jgi:hypothetical protein
MSAQDGLQPRQFTLKHEGFAHTTYEPDEVNQYAEPYHSTHPVEGSIEQGSHMLVAHTGNGRALGHMTWDKGVVKTIDVNKNWQHRGMGTQMWEKANQITPGLKHSDNRTDAGEGFAASVGGPKPERVQDHSEWYQ